MCASAWQESLLRDLCLRAAEASELAAATHLTDNELESAIRSLAHALPKTAEDETEIVGGRKLGNTASHFSPSLALQLAPAPMRGSSASSLSAMWRDVVGPALDLRVYVRPANLL